jgi:hypothetical protein
MQLFFVKLTKYQIFFSLTVWLFAYSSALHAAQLSVEETAALIAAEYNKKDRGVSDKFTLESSASSIGKNVIFTYVWAIRKNATSDEIENFIFEWRSEMIPKVCRANKKDYAFNSGLYYTFIYKNRSGIVVSEYSVDSALCKKIMK